MVERYKTSYAVGYRKPPTHAQFKKGQSGNPHGQPIKTMSVSEMMAEELQSTVFISEGGKRVKLNKFRVLFKQATNQAITGNIRPLVYALQLSDKLEKIRQTSTKNRKKVSPYDDLNLNKLSLDELVKLQREIIANSRPLSEMES
jgi:hypothetical protein